MPPTRQPQVSPRPGPRLLALLALLVTAGAYADDQAPPPQHRWLGEAQAGLLISSGNADARSANLKIDLARTDGPWKNIAHLAALYGSSSGINSAERIEGHWELDHTITARLFGFGSLDGNRDLFSGFTYQGTVAGGLGYKVIDSASTKLAATAGVGYRRLQTQTLTRDADGKVIQRLNGPAQGDAVASVGMNYEQALSHSTKISDKFLVISGSLNTAIANDLALNVAMSEVLALSIGYGIRDNTKPAAGVKKLDQLSTVNVVYNLK